MHRDIQLDQWNAVCPLERIVPDTGVCALLNGRQVVALQGQAQLRDVTRCKQLNIEETEC